ncbi:kojibiose phosphorylase [Fervidobacterium changbaicum]|uniref:Glycoside hydrolase family 65 protein n=1 Tax=Fervidobacterium changbaicum TaxID=310769 RepID=A0AAE5XAZ7_9BACT|nr:glycosyl hydrolase family 65 protein [Fervidobacterium changbaicum]QAV33223.1 glycoside hydrolase family 65 protein [Fervidobacterium changbaicum]SDH75717.1 kojibiose phosphorylase [Fervidobacterium changbaicum]
MWTVVRDKYAAEKNLVYETLFTLANGYMSLRGREEFSKVTMKGTYVAGVFDKHLAQVTELVNLPDPLVFKIYLDNEEISLDYSELLKYERKLDMKNGTLNSVYEFKVNGKVLRVESQRFVSRANIHRFGIKYTITPVNFSGKIIVENCIDTATYNGHLDPLNKIQHYFVTKIFDLKPGVLASVKTYDKGHIVSLATSLTGKNRFGENVLMYRKYRNIGQNPQESYTIFLSEGEPVILEKYGVIYTSRDIGLKSEDKEDEVVAKTSCELDSFIVLGLEKELEAHTRHMNDIWQRMDIVIDGDETAQTGIRFNLFHLYACAPDDPRVSIGARGIHGEGYKGHVFWDTEIFMFPFFLYTLPEYAKNLLLYRYNTLDGARRNAQMNGYKGAQFPWESADDGLEVTPKWGEDYLGNPVRIWTGDEEFHINADIAVALVHYHSVTGDDQFMIDYGVELLLETGRFWASRLEYNSEKDRYEIRKVIGPDEFHEHVDNNVYTNYLAKWNMLKAVEYYEWLSQKSPLKFEKLKTLLGLTEEEVHNWKSLAEKIYIPRKEGEKLIEQFEGYFQLEEVEITEWDENGLPKWPKGLDLTKLNETKLIKQPDVVMLMLVLPEEFDEEEMKINYEYYEKRTMHKSSLSPSMYSIMGLKVGDTHNAYKYFMKTLLVDLEDNQGNTNNGFHAASAGGAWQCVVNGFGGMTLGSDKILNFSPWLPENWKSIAFNVNYRGNLLNVSIEKGRITIVSPSELEIRIKGEKRKLIAGKNEFQL